MSSSNDINKVKLSERTDVDLAALCKSKDMDVEVNAVNELIVRYRALIEKNVKAYYNHSFFDDIKQEAYLGLLSAIFSFDQSKNVLFYTYANVCIQNKVKNYFAFLGTKKEQINNNALSYDDVYDDNAGSHHLNPEKIYIEQESYNNLIHSVSARLSTLEKEVLVLSINDYSYKDISKMLGVPVKSVDNALTRAKFKIRN